MSGDTYFLTSNTFEKKPLLQTYRMATLFVDTLYSYRQQNKYQLHEFVIMPDHFHLLLTPSDLPLERAIQFIKGGFSFQAKKQFGIKNEIWQTSFHDRRIRDASEYSSYRAYIHLNPVKRGLTPTAELFPFGSACGDHHPLDPVPQWLKPVPSRPELQA